MTEKDKNQSQVSQNHKVRLFRNRDVYYGNRGPERRDLRELLQEEGVRV